MGQKFYNETDVQAIANAIRGKNGTQNTYTVSQMAAAVTAIPTGSTASRCWTFTQAANSAEGASVTVATADSWLLAHRSDASLVITLCPMTPVTITAKCILAYLHTNSVIQAGATDYYGRSVRAGLSSASLSDNRPPRAIQNTTAHGFFITTDGTLKFFAGDAGTSQLIIPAGTWLVTASVKE